MANVNQLFQLNLGFLAHLSVNYTEIANTNAIAQAISDVIDELYVKDNISFDIYISGLKTRPLEDIATEILKRNGGKYACKINKFIDMSYQEISKSIIYLAQVDPFYSNIQQINVRHNSNSTQVQKILIYLKDFTFVQKPENKVPFDEQSKKSDLHNYFITSLINSSEILLIKNYVTTSSAKIHQIGPSVINIFNKKSLKWRNKVESLRNFDLDLKNYYVHINFNRMLRLEGYTERDGKVKGVFVDIFNIVAERGKFTPLYSFSSVQPSNEPLTPCQTIQIEPSLKLSTEHFSPPFSIETTAFSEEKFGFIITPPNSYGSYEKILMPFDLITWILLFSTFLLAFVTIMIVNNFPCELQNVVYGVNVQMPSYNVVSIFFGIGQTQLPENNFPRIILTLFIIFCLIFRTAYQGVSYELITSDVRKSSPSTIAELTDQNFTFYRNDMSYNIMNGQFRLENHA